VRKIKDIDEACPFNALYGDFLARHRERFSGHSRMSLICRQLEKIPSEELEAIRKRAAGHLSERKFD